MKAIVFDKYKNRVEMDVDGVVGEPIETRQEVQGSQYKVVFGFAFFDKKKRAVYMEKERKLLTKESGE